MLKNMKPKRSTIWAVYINYSRKHAWPLYITWTRLLGVYVLSWGRAFLLVNINRPDGATCSQTVYVPKYSARARVVSAIVGS